MSSGKVRTNLYVQASLTGLCLSKYRLEISRNLVARAMLITSLADPNLDNLLVTHEDMESAVFLSKIFTHAMVKKMQVGNIV